MHSWGYNEDNFDVARDLGSRLWNGSVSIDFISSRIMDLSSSTLMAATISMLLERTSVKHHYWHYDFTAPRASHRYRHLSTLWTFLQTLATEIPFAVSPERRRDVAGGEAKLITQDAEKYIIDPLVAPVPMFLGMTNREWLEGFYYYGKWNYSVGVSRSLSVNNPPRLSWRS